MDFILNLWVELGAWAQGVLAGWGLPEWAVNLVSDIVGVLILLIIGVMAVLIFTPMERKVIARMRYAHPEYTHASVAAQARRDEINGVDRIWYAGAYWGWGFHEDGIRSAIDVVRALGVRWPQ